MNKLLSQNDLIGVWSKRARFSKSDTKIFYDELVKIFEELIRESTFEDGESKILLLKSRGLGSLYLQRIPQRKGKDGQTLPETTRPIFKLSQNIKYANKQLVDIGLEEDLDKEDDM